MRNGYGFNWRDSKIRHNTESGGKNAACQMLCFTLGKIEKDFLYENEKLCINGQAGRIRFSHNYLTVKEYFQEDDY